MWQPLRHRDPAPKHEGGEFLRHDSSSCPTANILPWIPEHACTLKHTNMIMHTCALVTHRHTNMHIGVLVHIWTGMYTSVITYICVHEVPYFKVFGSAFLKLKFYTQT